MSRVIESYSDSVTNGIHNICNNDTGVSVASCQNDIVATLIVDTLNRHKDYIENVLKEEKRQLNLF